ncbi:DUF3611 family protein [Mastigocoleus sp. MO_188.B34]|uniref:DUF3611 family protein n=1 Tax=Mastigocoleus sp. MO_188.B34 TaxID=3036635 RepID=UPI0026393548|nr:DUF3611 family protein [Mastigocoleus sp. MO_188.B34]MDJ0695881.1 DUF3611 family protein [Mastigocoleus sp. MO_188.B34]
MKNTISTELINPKLEAIGKILQIVGWVSIWMQLGLGGTSIFLLILTISGRKFSRTVTPNSQITSFTQGTLPGISMSIFWAVLGILLLLFGCYVGLRIARYGRRLRSPQPDLHPSKAEVMQILRLGAILGFAGMLIFIIGSLSGLGVLLAKSISQPQGVTIYNPTRIIRSLDVFINVCNVTGIAAHFVGTTASAGLFIWLHPEL